MRLLLLIISIFTTVATFAKPVYLTFDSNKLVTYEYSLTDELNRSPETYRMYCFSESSSKKWILRTGIEREKVVKKLDFELTSLEKFDFKNVEVANMSGEAVEVFLVRPNTDGYTVTKIIELNTISVENEAINMIGPKLDFTYHKNIEPNINLSTDDSDFEVYFLSAIRGKYSDSHTFRLVDKNNMTRPKSLVLSYSLGIMKQSLNGNSEITLSKINGKSIEAFEKMESGKLAVNGGADLVVKSATEQSELASLKNTRTASDNDVAATNSRVVLTEKSGGKENSAEKPATKAINTEQTGAQTATGSSHNESGSTAINHQVQAGESLYAIAKKYNTSVVQLRTWNKLSEEIPLKPGMTLIVNGQSLAPKATEGTKDHLSAKGGFEKVELPLWKTKHPAMHEVQDGQDLSEIATLYGYTLERFRSFNGLKDDKIIAGQKLKTSDCTCENEKLGTSEESTNKVNLDTKPTNSSAKSENEVRVLSKPRDVKLTPKGSVSKKKYYVVKEEDSLQSIAKRNNVTIEQLRKWNNLEEKDILVPFQKIIIENK